MFSGLIVSSGEKGKNYLTELLQKAGSERLAVAATAGEARRLLIETDFDLCVINAPLSDENGLQLAEHLAQNGNCGVILCVKAEIYEAVSARMEDYGVLTVSKPVNRSFLWSAVKMSLAAQNRVRRVAQENRRLVQKIEDIRLVDRAKCLLISYLSMTEAEAHRYLEKQAMDSRLSKREIAERILKTYEN